ncbi:MAG: sulfite exporter TauE/SafE family protein, partial [Flavobacteriia bacterium]
PLQGGLYMVLFGLGTVPLMSAVVYSKGLFRNSIRAKMQKLVPVFVVIIGVLFIVRGLGLGIPYVSPKPAPAHSVTAAIECHQP